MSKCKNKNNIRFISSRRRRVLEKRGVRVQWDLEQQAYYWKLNQPKAE